MSNTDKAAEALRLAEYMRGMVHTYPQMSEDEPGGYCTEDDQCMDQASALLREYATLLQAQPAEAKHIQRLEAENEMLRESLKDADNELDWLDGDVDTCDHSVGVCMCSYWSMRRKMKAALASQRGNADIALLVFAVVCAVWLVIAGAMGWLPGCGL